MKCLLLFGAPGSGKGTQSELLKTKGFAHLSTGDLFRENIKNQTPLGIEAKAIIEKGDLVPDSITLGMLKEAIGSLQSGQDKNSGLTYQNFILDGFPRNLNQAKQLEALSEELGFAVEAVIFLEVPDKVLFERLTVRRLCKSCGAVYHMSFNPPAQEGVCDKCGGEVYQRKDDSAEVISNRLKTYADTTLPVKGFYESRGKLTICSGEGTPEEIQKRILKIVENF
ncbi:MAG: nucleoside monophosphate kinase [Bdellovibrionaceae bacterium]|nr:nucleoside monophosphate kinase [Pseudobdellovibrionaceae bacterium]